MSDESVPQDDHAPAAPTEPAPPIESRFLFVDVASMRATQLRRGARIRLQPGEGRRIPERLERAAMDEVRQGLVYYTVPDVPSPK